MIYLFIGIPLAAAFLSALSGKRYEKFPAVLAVSAAAALSVLSLAQLFQAPGCRIYALFAPPDILPGLSIRLLSDGLSSVMLVIANIAALITAVYSMGYMKDYTDRWKYYSLMLIMVCGVNGVLLTRDIFTLYVYMEMSTICVYALVAFGNEDEALEASFKYAVMGVVASAFIFTGIALLYGYTSSLDMSSIAAAISEKGGSGLVLLVSALFLVGFGLKSGLVPFHAWLPDAYSKSPATVPVLSSGILVKVLGVYALSRVFYNVLGMSREVSMLLLSFGAISMAAGAVLAFGQSDIRRLLGYSSVSQMGYIALGLGIGTPLAMAGAIFHALNHSAAKSLLFMSAGCAEKIFGTSDFRGMAGLAKRSGAAGYSGLAGALSICGVPPAAGFWSKLVIVLACVQAGHAWLGFFAAAISVLTMAYYFRALTPAFLGDPMPGSAPGPLPFSMKLSLVILAVIAAAGGVALLPGVGGRFINGAVAALLAPGVFR